MKHFRAFFWLFVLSLAALAFFAGYMLARGMVPLALLTVVLLIGVAAGFRRFVWRLVAMMSAFAKALEMHDATMRFPDSDDSGLNRMSESMNRVVETYNSSRLELETQKLYYDRILRIMSHELRNAITPIVSLSADMQSHPQRYVGENLSDVAEVIHSQSEGIKRFLDSYYELTHLPNPVVAETDMHDFFCNMQKTMAPVAAEMGLPQNVIAYTVAKNMRAMIDAGLMNQAIVNLLRNALEAVAGKDEPKVEVVVSCAGGHPYISISDNGGGIAPEMQDNLFQPFFTTKPGGSGIGLYLARQIVRMHKGDIVVAASTGHGTTFGITLP